MINCPKCGADNMVGAIFCRTCQEKLELDDLRPDQLVDEKKDGIGKKIGYILQRLIGVAIFLALVGILVALLLPASGRVTPDFDEKEVKTLIRLNKFLFKPTRKKHSFEFTSAEATALANYILGMEGPIGDAQGITQPDPQGMGMAARHLTVKFVGADTVTLILKCAWMKKLSVYNTLTVRLELTDDGVVYTVVSAAIGKVPAVSSMQDIVLRQFETLFSGVSGQVSFLEKHTRKLEIQTGIVKLSVR